MMIGLVFMTKILMVARNELVRHAQHEESGLARNVLCEASEESKLKGRLHGDIGVERLVKLKTTIIIFRKS